MIVISATAILLHHLRTDILSRFFVVYKIPYRRAPRLAHRPLGRVRRASKGILHTRFFVHLFCKFLR